MASFLAMTREFGFICTSFLFNSKSRIMNNFPKMPVYIFQIAPVTAPKCFLCRLNDLSTCFFGLLHYTDNFFLCVYKMPDREFGRAFRSKNQPTNPNKKNPFI